MATQTVRRAKALAIENGLELWYDKYQKMWYLQHDDYMSYAMGDFLHKDEIIDTESFKKNISEVLAMKGKQ